LYFSYICTHKRAASQLCGSTPYRFGLELGMRSSMFYFRPSKSRKLEEEFEIPAESEVFEIL